MEFLPVRLRRPLHASLKYGGAALALGFATASQSQITQRGDAVGKLLNEWQATGTAAGLSAITYENRDGLHSPLNTSLYPQLQVFKHTAETGTGAGPAVMLRRSPTVGNCSMAAPATSGGSLPRLYDMDPGGQTFLVKQYLSNNLFIYPEHQDYDIGANGIGGYGDLYPTNSVMVLISQGSSLSDQPFLQAAISTIAAFPPETQSFLIQKRFLMPTVQAIFRRSNRMVKEEADYFTGAAHPPVFDAAQLDEEKMVRMAHEMKPDTVPPVVVLEVMEETELVAGKNFFEAGKVHPYQMGTTPASITRLMRGNVPEYNMLVSAGKSGDATGKPIQVRWQLLQGDPHLVQIESSGQGPYARLRVRWHPPIIAPTGIRSNRVDIGVFATTKDSISAPAIISFYMLPNEMHFYDAKGRVSEIYYQAYNPDLGLPPSPKDTRWLKMFFAAVVKGDGLRSRLMEKLLAAEEREGLQTLWVKLNAKLEQVQALEPDPKAKERAAQLRVGLESDLAVALETTLPGKRGLTVRAALEGALSAIGDFADLYPSFQKELEKLAATSPKPSTIADIRSEVQRLQDLGVILPGPFGEATLIQPVDQLSAAERYYLRGLNLTLLSHVLFPEALERSTAPAWVDPRLTTPKPWRDIYRYDEENGALIGWIRRNEGRLTWFDPQGQLLPDGPKQPQKAQPVVFEKDAQGQLYFRPQ